MREGCKNCAIKHLAQASVLLMEAYKGYPEHIYYTIGHMAEAEDELVEKSAELCEKVRAERLKLMDNRAYVPKFIDLIQEIDAGITS